MKSATPRLLAHIRFKSGPGFDQPTVSYGDEKDRSDQRPQMGLSTIKRSDESRSPDDDRHGLGDIGLFLGVENRNGKESQQCAKE